MLSNLLGLTIDKGDLNKSSPSPVVSTLKKTAINYLAIGKMAEDLKLIKLNFSRYLAMEGVKVRGTPDMHFLKDDERTKKFNVLREKQVQSKMSAGAKDGTSGNKGWAKTLIAGFIAYKVGRKFERNLTASVLKRYRKLTAIRKLIRFKRKIVVGLNKLLGKLNIKKMFMDWFKTNSQKIMKPLIEMFSNAIKRFVKKGLTKLIQRATVSILAAAWSGPFLPIMAGVILLGLVLWEPVKEAWEAYTKGEDFIDVFIVSVIDSITFGIFGKDNIKYLKDSIANWFDTMAKKVFETIDESTKYIKEKTTEFTNFLINKGKALLAPNDKPENFTSAIDELNAKKAQEHKEMVEKYGKYIDEMNEKIEKTRIRIAQLKVEIAVLENDIKYLTEGPEKARLEEVKIEKAKEEQILVQQEVELRQSREGGRAEKEPVAAKPVAPPPKLAPVVTPTVTPTPKPAPTVTPAAKIEAPTPSKADSKYEDVKQMIMANEGYKNKPYKDSRGLWTVGVGHLIGNGKKMPIVDPKHPELGMITENRVFSAKEIRTIFDKDFDEHLLAAEQSPGWSLSNDAGKAGLIDLTYNVGPYWYKKLKDAAELLKDGKFSDAAEKLEKTGWYKQVKGRAVATVSLIRSGAAKDKSGSAALASVMSSQKVAAAGKFMSDESTQLAQAQREQLKPKDVNIAKVDTTNNVKKTNYRNVAMGDKPDLGAEMAKRAA